MRKLTENKSLSSLSNEETPRLQFFDNLRALLVIFVILFHTAAAYCRQVPFWPFHDSSIVAEQGPLDILMMYIDVFNMPIFFFIAGYFALPTIQRKGALKYLKSKLTRLGIPLLLIAVFILPFLDYTHYYTQTINKGIDPTNFIEYWIQSIVRITEFDIGLLDLSTYSYMTNQFYQRYAWFLSELLAFLVIFCFIYVMWNKWMKGNDVATSIGKYFSSEKRTFMLIVLGFAIGASYFLVDFFSSVGTSFFTLGNIIQFQPIKLGMFVGYFALGVYANSRKWFTDENPLASIKTSALTAVILSIVMIIVGRAYFRDTTHSLVLSMGFAFSLSFLGLSLLVLFTSLAMKYWSKPSIFQQKVTSNSYRMYLVHYIPVMIFPLFLGSWTGIIAEIKFLIIFLASLLVSYVTSQYFLLPVLQFKRKNPRQSIGSLQ